MQLKDYKKKDKMLPTELVIWIKGMNYIAIETLNQEEMWEHESWLLITFKSAALDSHFWLIIKTQKAEA